MDKILEELKKELGDDFNYSVGAETIIMTWSGEATIKSRVNTAELWIRDAPRECLSVAISAKSVSLIFKKEVKNEDPEKKPA